MSNLFSALHKYFPREDLSPKENQITEMLAQVLKHEAGFRNLLFEKWFGKLSIPSKVLITTQKAIPFEELTKYIDLMIEDDSDDNRGTLLLVAELKWDSGPSYSLDNEGKRDIQTKNYEKYINDCGACDPNDLPRLYLAKKIDVTLPDKWKCKRWADLHNLGRSYFSKSNPSSLTFGQGLLKEFLLFLEEEGIPEMPLELSDIAFLRASAEIFKKVADELRRIANGNPKKMGLDFTSGGAVLRLAPQVMDFQRYVLYSTKLPIPGEVVICFGIYPRPEDFGVDIYFPEGCPIAAMWFDCDPKHNSWKQLYESAVLSELCESQITPKWQRNAVRGSWVVCYRARTVTDLTGRGNYSERLETFFNEGFRALDELKLMERLAKEFSQ